MGDDNSTLRSIGAAGIALLLAAALIAGVGAVSADSHDGDDGDDADEESVFPEPVEISAAGLTVSVGPPEDVDGDGDVDYDDAMELAMTTEMGAYATG